ncbi:hypothetical protein [Ferrovibrio sp.]|uniref:hypothetical protein n=1 Tax=Ferrovibrio sp. TaxID=1917215 RepID=UPI003D0B893F
MAQKYPFANFQIDGKVVTLIMVAEAGISTPELAQRSMSAFQQKLGRHDLVLVAQGVSLTPIYIGAKPFVEKLKDMPLGRVNWQHFEA